MIRIRALVFLLPLLLGACALLEGTPPPIPVRPLAARIDCSYHDETDTRGTLRLDVAAARVRAFDARIDYPQHGVCRFALKDFRQTREMPSIELTQINGACRVLMWEQGNRVTVGFQQCEAMCTGSAHDQLLPMIYDRSDGSCA